MARHLLIPCADGHNGCWTSPETRSAGCMGRCWFWFRSFEWSGKTERALKESDRKLVEAIKNGDHAAFEELYRIHSTRVYNIALRILGNAGAASDVTQEVFAAVFSCIDRFCRS